MNEKEDKSKYPLLIWQGDYVVSGKMLTWRVVQISKDKLEMEQKQSYPDLLGNEVWIRANFNSFVLEQAFLGKLNE